MSPVFILTLVAATQEVTLSGEVGMTWASRDRVLNEASLWTPGGGALREGDTFVLPRISVRFDVEGGPVRAAVEIGNPVLDFDSADPRLQDDRLGEATALGFRLRQGWLEIFDVARVGAQDFLWDPVGADAPLFLAPSGAESPWGELPDSTVPPFPASGTNTVPQTRRDTQHPAGLTARTEEITLFALVMLEGGSPSRDEGLWGAAVTRTFDALRAGAVVALMTGGERKQAVWTGGVTLALDLEPFTLAAEGYRQFGSAGDDLRASGSAVRAGVRYAGEVWARGAFVRVSGDRRGDDDREGRFLSYEDNDATRIVEGNEFGLDVDSNYWSGQLSAGFGLDVGEKRLRPRVTAAIFRFLNAVPLAPDPVPGVGGRSKALGTEVDAGVDLDWSSRLSFTAEASMLLGSGVLEEFTLSRESRTILLTLGLRLVF